ncbi:3-oxoacyl-ACP synthase III family protein [Cellvibrio sp. OA-2007]|uniref:3-oxoacyl-ACP synthase III family protein n=1 Tax=Cellvibrio sp. OA-2007 TaxID=529823 RepID=UPI000785D6E9|nr:3-oxoacyl-ACP synthase III family protein [Cellvibrio sp. OA-2007]
MTGVKISALTVELPSVSFANDDPIFNQLPETSGRWWKFWGIKQRGFFSPEAGENEYQAALKASSRILQSTGCAPEEVDLLICAASCPIMTDGPGALAQRARLYPRLSTPLQQELGLTNALCWDVQMECASFLLALAQAAAFIRQGKARNALVICSEYISNMLDFTARSATIFADGCACALVTADATGRSDLLASAHHSNADFYEIATGCWRAPELATDDARHKLYFSLLEEGQAQMQTFVPHQVPLAIERALKKAHLRSEEIDFFVFHQPSPFLVHAWASGVDCPEHKTLLTMDQHGVMVSVSIPFTLYSALSKGLVKPGQRIVLAGAATGWGFAAQVWQMDEVVLC